MSELLSHEWPSVGFIAIALMLNMYFISAEKGVVPIGAFLHRHRVVVELLNWLLVAGLVVWLSYLYTWWFLLAPFGLVAVGVIAGRILGALTQVVFLIGAPILLALAVVSLVSGRRVTDAHAYMGTMQLCPLPASPTACSAIERPSGCNWRRDGWTWAMKRLRLHGPT